MCIYRHAACWRWRVKVLGLNVNDVVACSRIAETVSPSNPPPIAAAAPDGAKLTDYDRAHVATYLRLLDAAEECAPWEEVSRVVLGIDPAQEHARAKRAYDTHLSRAQWLTKQGYKEFLTGRR